MKQQTRYSTHTYNENISFSPVFAYVAVNKTDGKNLKEIILLRNSFAYYRVSRFKRIEHGHTHTESAENPKLSTFRFRRHLQSIRNNQHEISQ